jgi:hypothetical protein
MVWNKLGWVNCKGLNIQVRVVNYEQILLLSVIIKLLIRQPQKTREEGAICQRRLSSLLQFFIIIHVNHIPAWSCKTSYGSKYIGLQQCDKQIQNKESYT